MKSKLYKLKSVNNIVDLADLLGYKTHNLSFLLYKMPEEEKYTEFKIPKKSGGFRIIEAPNPKIKLLQQRTSDLLTSCYTEIFTIEKGYKIWSYNKTKSYSKSISHGFRKKHSIMTNASKHRNRRYVFNIDLKDFFPSINFGRVRGYFIHNKYFNLNEDISTILSQIICFKNRLPQGSPCSPIMSNLIGHILDIKMVKLARNAKCVYSRYADDLTFSTNKRKFPKVIAKKNILRKWIPSRKLKNEIKSAGFKLNNKKTVMQYKSNRQIVTGLVVNKKINVRKEYYRSARAMCNELFKSNTFYHNVNGKRIVGTLNELDGILGHIYHVKKFDLKRVDNKTKEQPVGIQNMYRKFLFYKYFYRNDRTTIVTEGITDPIYLKSAFKNLKEKYPFLYNENDDIFNFSFFNFKNQRNTLFNISAGTSGLQKLITSYEDLMKHYHSDGLDYPVVILLDNDSGANKIKSMLESKFKIKKNDNKSYHRLCLNLYVTFVIEDENSAIENLFPEDILTTKISGKSFNKKNEMDTESEYGKVVFANAVIKPNYKDIDFSLFEPAVNKLGKIMQDYMDNRISIIQEHKDKIGKRK